MPDYGTDDSPQTKMRRQLMQRNIAALKAAGGGVGQVSPMGQRAKAMLAQMSGGSGPGQASIPSVPPPSAPAIGRGGGVSELGRGLDPAMANRIQAAFSDRARREATMAGQPGDQSSSAVAKRRRDELMNNARDQLAKNPDSEYARLLVANGGRPSTAANNALRRQKYMTQLREQQMAAIQPELALINAQRQMTPGEAAHTALLQAQTDAIRSQIPGAPGAPGGQPPAAGPPPGAPVGPMPPAPDHENDFGIGAQVQQLGPGVRRGREHPLNPFTAYKNWANSGGWNLLPLGDQRAGQPVRPPPGMVGNPLATPGF